LPNTCGTNKTSWTRFDILVTPELLIDVEEMKLCGT